MSLPIVRLRSRKFWLLLIILIAVAGWLWPKKVPPETLSYYSSLLCAVVDGPQQTAGSDFTSVLRKTVEGSNSDYSLRKYHYDSAAGTAVVSHWNALSADQQQQAKKDNKRCLELLRSAS